MRVLRVKEKICGRCGRGLQSGYRYPDCATPPQGMTWAETHSVFCRVAGNELCADCRGVVER